MITAAGDEGAFGLVHQAGHLRRFERDRQRAHLDAPLVQQVAEHLVGLLVDDTEELARLGQVRAREAPSTAVAELSGVHSSWLIVDRNSARWRSSFSSGARSCRVTIIDSTAPSAERIFIDSIGSGCATRPAHRRSAWS